MKNSEKRFADKTLINILFFSQTRTYQKKIKIENTKADFEATFASVVSQLQADVAKIEQYLK